LAKHTDGAAIQTLDLGDVVEERLRSGFGIHGRKYMCMPYTKATKKSEKLNLKNFVRRPHFIRVNPCSSVVKLNP
jgi:hypothetical protein